MTKYAIYTLLLTIFLIDQCLASTFIRIDDSIVEASKQLIATLDSFEAQSLLNDTINYAAQPLISSGTEAAYGQFPFMASLQLGYGDASSWPTVPINGKNYSIPSSYHYCGGTLLWNNLILTAAHCIGRKDFRYLPSFVLIGGTVVQTDPNKLTATNAPEKFAILGYSVHPSFTLTDDDATNDVAILQIAGFSKQPYVNISSSPIPIGQTLTAIGWGMTEKTSATGQDMLFGSEILMFTDYKVSKPSSLAPQDNQSCPDSPGILCMAANAVPHGYQSTCEGDSGGPQMIQGTNYQAGLTSYGPNGCGNTTWDAITNVGHYYDSFIRPAMINLGLPNPISSSKSQCPTKWVGVMRLNVVFMLDKSPLIYYKQMSKKSVKECSNGCVSDSQCYIYRYDPSAKICSMSSARPVLPLMEMVSNNGYVSGYIQCDVGGDDTRSVQV